MQSSRGFSRSQRFRKISETPATVLISKESKKDTKYVDQDVIDFYWNSSFARNDNARKLQSTLLLER